MIDVGGRVPDMLRWEAREVHDASATSTTVGGTTASCIWSRPRGVAVLSLQWNGQRIMVSPSKRHEVCAWRPVPAQLHPGVASKIEDMRGAVFVTQQLHKHTISQSQT